MASIARFVDDVPKDLLLALLSRHDVRLPEMDPAVTAKELASAIEHVLAGMGPGNMSAFQAAVDEITAMGDERGSLAITQADLEIPETLPSARARALWLMLKRPDVYQHAESILFSNVHRGKRDWTPFQGKPGVNILGDEEARKAFEDRLRLILDTRNVEVEIFERASHRQELFPEDAEFADRALQITIYSEDRPHSELGFEDRRVVTRSRCPVREAAIVYEPNSGAMECVARERGRRAEIVEAFSLHMLRETNCPVRPLRIYTLEPLRQRTIFEFDPRDGIEEVSVTSMMLVPIESALTRVTIDRGIDCPDDIWTIIDDRLGSGVLAAEYELRQALITVRYRGRESRRMRSLPIRITQPTGSNIPEQTDFESMVSRKYLPQWGLIVS